MIDSDQNSFAIPLVVAVTGHRDLVPSETPGIRDRVRRLFENLQQSYPHRSLHAMSPLAEGADQLVAEVALELGIELTVALPMPKHLYLQDFDTPESRARFESLCDRAIDVFVLPLSKGKHNRADFPPRRGEKPGVCTAWCIPVRTLPYPAGYLGREAKWRPRRYGTGREIPP